MGMSNLPLGWASCEMKDIARIVGGGTPKADDTDNFSDDGFPWITPADLSSHKDRYISRGRRSLSNKGLQSSSAVPLPQGTVVFSSRAPIGYVAVAANPLATNQGFRSFVCEPGIIPEYVYCFLLTAKPIAEQMASGTTFLEISGTNAGRIPIVIPPTGEQRRIVAKLEKLLARVDACREQLDRVPVLLKRFRQSVLAAACSGRLTEDWRENCNVSTGISDMPESWSIITFSELIHSFRSGSAEVPTDQETNYPILRSSSVRPGQVDLADVRFLRKEQSDNIKNFLEDGDLLFTRLSGSIDYVGNGAVVSSLEGMRIQYPDRIFCAKLIDPSHARYIELCFASPDIRAVMTQKAKSSAGHQRISMGDIKGQRIPLPPKDEEIEIVRRVTALFAFADQVETRYQQAKAHTDRLTQSILAKAFRGELVPQDPNDEPAHVLLQRINQHRKLDGADNSRRSRKVKN